MKDILDSEELEVCGFKSRACTRASETTTRSDTGRAQRLSERRHVHGLHKNGIEHVVDSHQPGTCECKFICLIMIII